MPRFDPESDLDFDQTPAFDPGSPRDSVAWGRGPAEPEPVPDFDALDPDGGA